MSKSYQVIEPDILFGQWGGKLIHLELTYRVLCWLVDQLNNSQDQKFDNVDIEVINVKYVNSYPAIGIHYKNPNDEEISEYLEEKVEKLLKEKSVIEFLNFSLDHDDSWKEGLGKFLED